MPPRKRARVSQAASPTPVKTPTPAEESADQDEELLDDPWTDDEEIGLFKGLIKWKPTGIHKHFHLLNLHQFMLDGGYIHPRNEHTKPAGIWRKLRTLYNLETLDEREDARQLEKVKGVDEEESDSDDEDEDVYSEAANKIANEDFDLPGEELADMKWARRLQGRLPRDESPPVLPELNMAEEAPIRFKPSFSIEPDEIATPVARRGRPRAGTAGSKAKPAAAVVQTTKRRSTRAEESVVDEEEEQERGEDEDEDEEEGQDEEEEDEEEEASEQSTPAPRSTRRTRGRPAQRSRGRGRGRGK